MVGEFRGWKGEGEAEWPRKGEEKEVKRRRKGGGGKLFLPLPFKCLGKLAGRGGRRKRRMGKGGPTGGFLGGGGREDVRQKSGKGEKREERI